MQPSSEQQAASAEYLCFRLHQERFALAARYAREIARWETPTPVPGAPPLLPGIINRRGQILAIIDLRLLLNFPPAEPDRSTRLIWIHHDEIDAALLVDAVEDVITLEASQLEPPPTNLQGSAQRLITAIFRLADQPVAILDPAAILTLTQESS